MSAGMWSQVYYHEWSPKSGRVLFTDAAIEVRSARYDPNTWISGLWTAKVIPYDTIRAGYAIEQFVRVVFAGDDEIMFHRRVFDQCPSGAPPFLMLDEAVEIRGMWAAVEAMRARQRALPPVSWAEGRQTLSPRSWRSVRAVHVVPGLLGGGLLLWSLVRR